MLRSRRETSRRTMAGRMFRSILILLSDLLCDTLYMIHALYKNPSRFTRLYPPHRPAVGPIERVLKRQYMRSSLPPFVVNIHCKAPWGKESTCYYDTSYRS